MGAPSWPHVTALTPFVTHTFLGFSLQRSQKVQRLRSYMEVQILVKSWPSRWWWWCEASSPSLEATLSPRSL